MNRPRRRPIIGPAPIEKLWLANELKEIKTLQAVTLAEVKDSGSASKYVIPELAAAIQRGLVLIGQLDATIPDKKISQSKTTTKKKG